MQAGLASTPESISPRSPTPAKAVNGASTIYGWLAAALIAISAVLSLLLSRAHALWSDELFSLEIDRLPTVRDVLWAQMHYPINVDPPTYHALSHLFVMRLGPTPLALRMPALLGFLFFQACLYLFVKRLAGPRAGIVSLIFPMAVREFYLSLTARPYALLDAACILSLLCWQYATRNPAPGWRRWCALAGLSLALFIAVTSHYSGVLILVPVCCAEAWRSLRLRRLDLPVVAALLLGVASIAVILPYRAGALPFHQHYVTGVYWEAILDTYDWILMGWTMVVNRHVTMALVMAFTIGLGVLVYRRFRSGDPNKPTQEGVALLMTVLIPVWSFLMGKFVTHAVEVRYSTATLVAFAVGVGIALEKPLRRNAIFYGIAGLLLCVAVVRQVHNIVSDGVESRQQMTNLAVPPEIRSEVVTRGRRIYMQSVIDLLLYRYYEPDEQVRNSLTLVYGPEDLRWLPTDMGYLTAKNLEFLHAVPVVSYDQLLHEHQPLVVLHPGALWEWLGMDLAARGYAMQPKGPLFGGSLVEIQTTPTLKSEPNSTTDAGR